MSKELLELTPAQDMINFMLKYSFFHKQVIQIPASVTVKKKIDFEIMKKALNIEIERNDCMRIRFVKKGGKLMQYFLDEYHLDDIPVVSFNTKEEQEAYLNADACRPVRYLKGETYRIIFFNAYDGRQGIYINVNHITMDAAAVFVFYSDLFAVYDSVAEGKEMPRPLAKFRDVIDREFEYINNKEKTDRDKNFYTEFFKNGGAPIFNGVHGPELLKKARAKKKNPNLRVIASFDPVHDKAELIKRPISKDDSRAVLDYLESTGVSPECLIQLAMRLYLAKLNESINDGIIDTYFVTLCTRRKTLAEKKCGGSMTSTLPWRIVLDPELTFEQALEKLRELQYSIFKHQDYPFLKWRDIEGSIYNYGMADGASTMMFSWFPLEKDTMNGWEYEFNGYCIGHYVMPLYTYTMKDLENDSLKFAYLYRTNHISADNINSLHDNTVRILNIGCKNPGTKLKDIYEMI